MKKYKLSKAGANGLRRIVSIRSFGNVKKGAIGGYVASEENLSQDGACWVSGEARVYGAAQVSGEAQVSGKAQVYGAARVCGEAQVYGAAQVSRNPFCFTGLLFPVSVTDNHVQVGCELILKSRLLKDGLEIAKRHGLGGKDLRMLKLILMALVKAHGQERKP